MMLVIQTQDQENYGAHDWDGKGSCPQYWKFKGGSEYKITNIPSDIALADVVDMVRSEIECNNDHFRTDIVSYGVEADDYLSWFEKSQLDYEGEVTFQEPVIDFRTLESRFTDPRAFAEESADADAV